MSQKIKLKKLQNKGNAKGLVFNLTHPNGKIVEIPIFYREKGMSPDGHFHRGLDKSNDPQILFIISGKISVKLKFLDDIEQTILLEKGDFIEIPKFVYHSYDVLEDSIFAEPRLTSYGKSKLDVFSFKDFQDIK